MTKKHAMDFRVNENVKISPLYSLLKLSPIRGNLPDCQPGQFAQVAIPHSANTFLRRPISINWTDTGRNELWLLVRRAGTGTATLCGLRDGEELNLILPLGNGYTVQGLQGLNVLLIGGGVGVAPLLLLGRALKDQGANVRFLIGARSQSDLLELDMFRAIAPTHVSTEDGSMGEPGFVTQHSILREPVDNIACCGPLPMMKAVAQIARTRGVACEVSLENMMACGMGACLCCVEDTADRGNVCVCTEGPVFNIKRLKW